MTKEKRLQEMQELMAKVDALVIEHNMLTGGDEVEIPDGETAATMLQKNEKATDEAVNEYTSHAKALCFAECAETDDPMLEAVKRLTYESICVKDTENKDEGTIVRTREPKARRIDLAQLHKYVDGGIGHEKDWNAKAEKLNFLLTVRQATRLGIDPKAINDSYYISDIAKQIDMGKNPTSNTNLLKTLQIVIDAMIGPDFKATSHHVNDMVDTYTKRSNKTALARKVANHSTFRQELAEICHAIVLAKGYTLEYKTKKESK